MKKKNSKLQYQTEFDKSDKLGLASYTHYLDRQNKWGKLEHIGKVIFDILFMTQSHAESMKKNPGSPLGTTS